MLPAIIGFVMSAPFVASTIAAIDSHSRRASYFRRSKLLAFMESGSAWFLGLIFLSGGLSKLMPFPGFMGPVWLEEQLAPYGLGMFARFIAWSEAIIGVMLLAKQTRVLGAIMMVPMLINILMVTVSMSWQGTPWIIMIFLAANLFLLAYHYPRWQPIIDTAMEWTVYRSRQSANRNRIAMPICLATILSGPLLFLLNPTFAGVLIVVAFVGLLWNEVASRFENPIETGERSSQKTGDA